MKLTISSLEKIIKAVKSKTTEDLEVIIWDMNEAISKSDEDYHLKEIKEVELEASIDIMNDIKYHTTNNGSVTSVLYIGMVG
jgi:hypothetical protein